MSPLKESGVRGLRLRTARLEACPICGKSGRDGHVSQDPAHPHIIKCWKAPSASPGWEEIKGKEGLYRRLDERRRYEHRDAYRPRLFPTPHSPAAPAYTASHAHPAQCDAAYRALFDTLSLSGIHRNQIACRGLSADRASMFGYPLASLKTGSRVGIVERIVERAGVVSGVPGFYADDYRRWTLAGSPGLLLPVMDVARRIIAVQIRTDTTYGGRFRWLSSADRPGGMGSGSPAGYIAPISSQPPAHIWLTEGFFKALAIADRLEEPAIWLGGVSQYKAARDRLEEIEAVYGYRPEIWIAYDADLSLPLRARERPSQHVNKRPRRRAFFP